ncbi:phosphoprotein [Shaan virus]|uniref:Phosphoprotein n=1 Tax=Shaan virus TaxID=2848072 RepID=A0A346NTM1_9MONO|nr:phosphoprotein [Bat paramyxovirus]AXR70614.1 phosphoprotein [Shaan virus]
MSRVDKLSASVDNGLAIAEFIQENRSSIQSTYGRSSIGEPTIANRAKAWELYIDRTNSRNAGHEGKLKSINELPEGKGSETTRVAETSEIEQSPKNQNSSSGDGSGDFNFRFPGDSSESDIGVWSKNSSDLSDVEGRSISISEGEAEPETSNDVPSQVNESSRDHAREGADQADEQVVSSNDQETTTIIENPSKESIASIMEESGPMPKRRLKNASRIKETVDAIPADTPIVKKTTGENIQLQKKTDKLELSAGATQSAHPSPQIQSSTNADVDTAQDHVHYAKMTEESHPLSKTDTNQIALEKKLDKILENQEKILKKLEVLSEVKEEVNAIKKTLSNQSLALSTIENYIGEMMVIIPKSGVPEDENNHKITKNPDLRPVIGRDSTRGKKEVIRPMTDRERIDIDEDFYNIPVVDEKYFVKPINKQENNAANFVPKEDKTSYRIIRDIIRKEVKDPEARDAVIKLFNDSIGKVPINEIYDGIRMLVYTDILDHLEK